MSLSRLGPLGLTVTCTVRGFGSARFFDTSKSAAAAAVSGRAFHASVWKLKQRGGHFCAGFDLKELCHQREALDVEQDVTKGPGPMVGAFADVWGPSRMQFTKPVIAAVSGYAVAGGLELSLLADLRVMEESAITGVFCRRFGIAPLSL
ncbi:ECHD2 protein, partial [Polypterus senegalus]